MTDPKPAPMSTILTDEGRIELAKNPETPPEMLSVLVRVTVAPEVHEAIVEAVFGNANLTPGALVRALEWLERSVQERVADASTARPSVLPTDPSEGIPERFAKALLANPTIDLWNLTEPGWANTLRLAGLQRLCATPLVAVAWVEQLAPAAQRASESQGVPFPLFALMSAMEAVGRGDDVERLARARAM